MRSVLKRELLLNLKNLLIWSLSVGALGLVCILLYKSMEGEMADAFSNMGAFSEAFGMSTLSIATLKGYFATEIGAVHGLGSCMFAAIIAINIISKEEDAHTGEFLFSLPLSRSKILAAKMLCVFTMLIFFTTICTLFYLLGFSILGEEMPLDLFFTFMARQFLMNLEVAGICLALSSLTGKNRMGLGLGMKYLFIGPFSYANASEIFTKAKLPVTGIVVACGVLICGVLFAFWYYNKRDLAS